MKKERVELFNLSTLPSIDALLQGAEDYDLPHNLKKNEARAMLAEIRKRASSGKSTHVEDLVGQYHYRLQKIVHSLQKVINGTGVIIHTNMGRSPLSSEMFQSLELLKDSYVNLELNLADGRRGNRHDHLRPWIQALTDAENGLLVNNNAAAVLLTLNTIADKKEVIISRGQLVEIGGSFRIPEIIRKAGSKLVEVGTTNRTHLKDYEDAITPRTRLLLWVHSSNYKITGFTKEVSIQELVALGKKYELPVMADLGSGALVPIEGFGLQREPLVSEVASFGVDVVTFSVDKLLGGPQGGIIAGKHAVVSRIEKNNLLRALRPDKTQILLTLIGLQAFSKIQEISHSVPIYRDLTTPITTLKVRARQIVQAVSHTQLKLDILDTSAQVGSGASPSETMPSVGITIRYSKMKATKLAAFFRTNEPAIMGRIYDDLFMIDLKAVREHEDVAIIKAFNKLE